MNAVQELQDYILPWFGMHWQITLENFINNTPK